MTRICKMIYQMMNGRISKRTLTKMIKAYYMCAQNTKVTQNGQAINYHM